MGGEVVREELAVKGCGHDYYFRVGSFLVFEPVGQLFESHEGEVHLETAFMDFIQEDVGVGEGGLEEQLLDQDAVSHVDDAAVLALKGL